MSSEPPWFTITVEGLVRIGVRAWSAEHAWRIFLDTKFSEYKKKAGRHVPPLREECDIRRADPAEVIDYEVKRKRKGLPAQDSALFDKAEFDKGKQREKDPT